jgi:hypothetical protein
MSLHRLHYVTLIGTLPLTTETESEDEISAYSLMNSALRNRDRQQVELFKDYIWLLFHALWHAPVYKGHTLFRARPKAASHYADTTTNGVKYTDYSFASATQHISVTKDFVADSAGTQWVYDIRPSYARDINIFSHYAKESEVLLLPGIEFHVKGQVKHGRVTEVQTEQVSCTHAHIHALMHSCTHALMHSYTLT